MRPLPFFCSKCHIWAMAALLILAANDLWPCAGLHVSTGRVNGLPGQWLLPAVDSIDHLHWAHIIMSLAPRRKAQWPTVQKIYAYGFALTPSHLLTQFPRWVVISEHKGSVRWVIKSPQSGSHTWDHGLVIIMSTLAKEESAVQTQPSATRSLRQSSLKCQVPLWLCVDQF